VDGARQRVRDANKVLAIVAKHGRQFFVAPGYDLKARFGLDGYGQIWYVDENTGMQLYPFDRASRRWVGFSNSEALQEFIEHLANYIRSGQQLAPSMFDIESETRAARAEIEAETGVIKHEHAVA